MGGKSPQNLEVEVTSFDTQELVKKSAKLRLHPTLAAMFTRAAVFTAVVASAAAFQPALRAGVAPKVRSRTRSRNSGRVQWSGDRRLRND